jgi:hypothetical protein
MDEKGVFLGRITKAKRVFPKDLKASGKLLAVGQDGSIECITVVATICGDGTSLPPLLIYDSTSGSIHPLVAGPPMRLVSSGSKISPTRKLGKKPKTMETLIRRRPRVSRHAEVPWMGPSAQDTGGCVSSSLHT